MKFLPIFLYLSVALVLSINFLQEIETIHTRNLAISKESSSCFALINPFLDFRLSTKERREILSRPEVVEFLRKADEDFKITFKNTNNSQYITRYIYGDDPGGIHNEYYIEFENSIMKTMNDKFFLDKNVTFTLNKYIRTEFWKNVQKALKDHQVERGKHLKMVDYYMDWKSLRLVMNTTSDEAMYEILNFAYHNTIRDFRFVMNQLGFSKLAKGFGESFEDPAFWFLAGFGKSPWKAYLSARRARIIFKKNKFKLPMILRYSASGDGYEKTVKFISNEVSNLAQIQNQLASFDDLIKRGVIKEFQYSQHFAFSVEAMDIFRKAQGNTEEILSGIHYLYGHQLTEGELNVLLKYHEKIEFFSPPVFVERQIDDWLYQNIRDTGAVSFDFRQIGANVLVNLQNDFIKLVLESSNLSEEELAEAMLELIKNQGLKASKYVEELTSDFTALQTEILGPGKKGVEEVIVSGDEGIFYPREEISLEQQKELVRKLSHQRPGKFRIVFLPPNYQNKMPISEQAVASLISDAEGVEKELRKSVMGYVKGRIHPKKMDKITMCIRSFPDQITYGPLNEKYFPSSVMDLMIYGGDALTKEELDILFTTFRRIIESHRGQKGVKAGKVIQLDELSFYFKTEQNGFKVSLLAA